MKETLIFAITRNASLSRLLDEMIQLGVLRCVQHQDSCLRDGEDGDDMVSLAWQDVREAMGNAMKEYPLERAARDAGRSLPAGIG